MSLTAAPGRPVARAPEVAAGPGATDLSSMASASLANGLASGVGGLASFGLTVVVGRRLGAAGAGLWFQAVAVVTILGALSTFGAEPGVMRSLARVRAEARHSDIRPLLLAALVPVVVVGVLAALALETAAPFLARAISSAHPGPVLTALRLLAPVLPLLAAERVATAAMRGLGVNAPTPVLDSAGLPLARLLLAGAVAITSPSLVGLSAAWALPSVAVAVGAVWWLRRVLRARPATGGWWRGVEGRRRLAVDFWSFTWARGLAQVLQVATIWVGVILTGVLGTPRQAGVYGAVTRVAIVGTLVLESVNAVLAPRLSAALARGETAAAQRLYQVATGWAVTVGFPLYLTLAVFPGAFLALFGHRFHGDATALTILCLAMLWNLATGPVTVVLLMFGKSTWNLANTAATLAVAGVGGALLIPRFGATGAALSWAAAIGVENGLPLLQVRRGMGLQPLTPATLAVVGASVVTFGGLGLLARLAHLSGPGGAVLAAVPALGLYAVLLRSRAADLELDTLVRALGASRRPAPAGARPGPS